LYPLKKIKEFSAFKLLYLKKHITKINEFISDVNINLYGDKLSYYFIGDY